MNIDLKNFVAQWLRVATMALVPVVFTAFAGIPLALERHPGAPLAMEDVTARHLTQAPADGASACGDRSAPCPTAVQAAG